LNPTFPDDVNVFVRNGRGMGKREGRRQESEGMK
jgi:hypothetical protein